MKKVLPDFGRWPSSRKSCKLEHTITIHHQSHQFMCLNFFLEIPPVDKTVPDLSSTPRCPNPAHRQYMFLGNYLIYQEHPGISLASGFRKSVYPRILWVPPTPIRNNFNGPLNNFFVSLDTELEKTFILG